MGCSFCLFIYLECCFSPTSWKMGFALSVNKKMLSVFTELLSNKSYDINSYFRWPNFSSDFQVTRVSIHVWNASPIKVSGGFCFNRNTVLACVLYSRLLNRLWLSEASKFYVTTTDVTVLITNELKMQFFFLLVYVHENIFNTFCSPREQIIC